MTVSPSWPVVGVILILIGLLVKFEVQVIDPDENEEIENSKEIKS